MMSNAFRIRVCSMAATAAMALCGAMPAAAAAADELQQLKSELATLQARIGQLEAQARAAEETNDRQTDQLAVARSALGSWVQNFTFKGDFRYRNENIEQQFTPDRNRDRLRVRAGFTAKVNDTVRTEFQLATSEGNDPRSSNQTLGGGNSRKNVFIDLAYVEWQAFPAVRFTAGRMKYPWVRAGASSLFDSDVNPEGLAVNWSRGELYASAIHNILEERSGAGESTMTGAQVGWRPAWGAGRVNLAAGYFDFHSVRRRNPFFNNSANGNTTTAAGCIGGATSCLAFDYDLIEAIAEYSRPLAGRPLSLYADYVTNEAATNGLDTAMSLGFTWGRASDPRSWEIGYNYQVAGKDAVFAQYTDSDMGAGNTDYRAHILRLGYAPARNWTLNLTWQLADTNIDVPASVADVGPVEDRHYDRLQLDLNFRF